MQNTFDKMDRLEQYIRENREQFDSRNPDPAIWSAIESRLPQREARRISIWKITSAAAVALVFILSGVIVGLRMNEPQGALTAEYVEYQETKQYYSNQLQQRVNALSAYEPDEDVYADLNELQDVYDQLTTELEDGLAPNQNDIIQALIQNYQTRIELLERVLERLEESKEQMDLTSEEDENLKI